MREEGLVMKRRALSTLMALSLFCAGGAAMADGAYTPGTYTVSADGNNGAITLRVEMTADAIADIKVVSQSETAGLGDVAIDKMIEAILVAGNTDVDTVSQATVSSEAVIAAVNAALSRAEKGEVDTVASPVAEAVTEETFADQCKAAGIDFTYETRMRQFTISRRRMRLWTLLRTRPARRSMWMKRTARASVPRWIWRRARQ